MTDRARLLCAEKIASDASQRAPTGGAITGATLNSPTITNPNITGGTQLNPSITSPSIVTPGLLDPTISGVSTFQPDDPSPLTTADVVSEIFTGETTAGAHLGVILATIPLPGTVGAPDATGVLELDVEVTMVSTTTTAAARFKLTWQWSVRVPGSPLAMGTLTTSLSVGTNAGAPPAGWAATLELDETGHNARVSVNGDAALTVHCKVSAKVGYTT